MPLWLRDRNPIDAIVVDVRIPKTAFPENPERLPPRHVYSRIIFESSLSLVKTSSA